MFDYFRALDGLTGEEREIHATVRSFVDEAIVPHSRAGGTPTPCPAS